MPFWAAAAKETFSTLSLEKEKERERKGTRRVATVQININHCVIIFCCQLNLSKVFIIHKCKTTFDKSFRPRSTPDKVRDRDRERNSRRAAYLSCVCLRQLLLGPNSNTHLRLPLLHPWATWQLCLISYFAFVLFTFGLFCFICISCDFCRFLWDFLKDFILNAFYFGFLSIFIYLKY